MLSAYRDRLLGRKLPRSQVLKMFQRLNITTSPGTLRNSRSPPVGPRSIHTPGRDVPVPSWREFVHFLLRSSVEEDVINSKLYPSHVCGVGQPLVSVHPALQRLPGQLLCCGSYRGQGGGGEPSQADWTGHRWADREGNLQV